MNKSSIFAFVTSVVACAFVTTPARAADAASGKGILDSGWNYVQYLFADGAASNALTEAKKAAAAKGNVLGLGAARELQAQAESQLQLRDFLGADKTLRRALSLAPEVVSIQTLLAVAIHGQGRAAEARSMLEALVKTPVNGKANVDTLIPAAAAYNSIGDPRRAVQIYSQLIAENVDSAAVYAGRGEAFQRLGDDVAALASFQLASELEPRFLGLELKRAQSLEKLGRSSEAENAYRVALQLDPTSDASRLGVARSEGGRATLAKDIPETPKIAGVNSNAAAAAVADAVAMVAPKDVSVVPTAKETAAKKSVKKSREEADAAQNSATEKNAAAAVLGPAPASATAQVTAPATATDKTVSAETRASVLAQLSKWQAAWVGKEIDAYLGFYSRSFKPVNMDIDSWEADRRAKLGKPGLIKIKIVEPTFETESGVVKVSFTQEYSSSTFRDKTRKRMDWVQDGGEWRIQREVAQ
jgi:tetratricopeptide (TPR) repeat protein